MRILIFTVLLFTAPTFGQQPRIKTSKPKDSAVVTPTSKALSESFAKAALLALKAIEGDAREVRMREGQLMVDRAISDRIDAADVEATTTDEKAIVVVLQSLLIGKETDNTERHTAQLRARIDAGIYRDDDPRVLSLPKPAAVAAIEKREAACFAAFEAILRARSSDVPSACKDQKGTDAEAPRKEM